MFPTKNFDKIPTHISTPEPATELELTTEPTKAIKAKGKTKCKISQLKLHKKNLNKIKHEEKNINEQIFKEYFSYEFPSFLV